MYKFIGFCNFAEWFFAEGQQSQAEEFRRFRDVYINPYIDQILAYGLSHPDFLTPDQRNELQTAKTSDALFDALAAYDRIRFDQADLADMDKIIKNMNKEKARFAPDKFATFSDLINSAGLQKTGKILSHLTIKDVVDFLNYVTTKKWVYSIKNAETRFLTGGSGSSEEGSLETPDQSVSDVETKDKATEKAEQSEQVDKIIQCVRHFISQKASKQARKLAGLDGAISSAIESDDEILDLPIMTDVKTYSLLQLIEKFIKHKEKFVDKDGIPHVKSMFRDADFYNLIMGEYKTVKKIIDNENFKPWLMRQIKDGDADAKALVRSTLGIAMIYALLDAGSQSQGVGKVFALFNELPIVKEDPSLQSFISAVKNKFLTGEYRAIRNSKVGKQVMSELPSGGEDALHAYMADYKFPDRNKGESAASAFFDFLPKIKGNKGIDWTKSCEEILAELDGMK